MLIFGSISKVFIYLINLNTSFRKKILMWFICFVSWFEIKGQIHYWWELVTTSLASVPEQVQGDARARTAGAGATQCPSSPIETKEWKEINNREKIALEKLLGKANKTHSARRNSGSSICSGLSSLKILWMSSLHIQEELIQPQYLKNKIREE